MYLGMLKKNKQYYFALLTGGLIRSISKINFETIGVHYCSFNSSKFIDIIKSIEHACGMLEKDIADIKYFQLNRITFLLYAETEEKLEDAILFLMILQPSKLTVLLEFSAFYEEYEIDNRQWMGHTISGVSYTIHPLTSVLMNLMKDKSKDLFYLAKNEPIFINKLLKKYSLNQRSEALKKSLTIYQEAFLEKKRYVRYILLMMIIESLIVSDEKTGVIYKVRRISAILVGWNKETCQGIYDKMSQAYVIRSKLIHAGKNSLHEGNYLKFINSIVSEILILMLLNENSEKRDFFSLSTELGFGDKHKLIKDNTLKKYSFLLANEINFILDLKEKKKK